MNFYWSIVALQCCVSFCYAANWSSYVPACSIVSDSFHGLQPTRLLCPWDFPGRNTGGGCHFLLQNQLYVYIYPPPLLGFLPTEVPTEHWTEFPVLCSSHQSSISHVISTAYVCQYQSASSFHPIPSWYPYICSGHLCLYFCFAIRPSTLGFFNWNKFWVFARILNWGLGVFKMFKSTPLLSNHKHVWLLFLSKIFGIIWVVI